MVSGLLGVVLRLVGIIFECILRGSSVFAIYWYGRPACAGCSELLKLLTTTDELTDLCIYNTPSPKGGKFHP